VLAAKLKAKGNREKAEKNSVCRRNAMIPLQASNRNVSEGERQAEVTLPESLLTVRYSAKTM